LRQNPSISTKLLLKSSFVKKVENLVKFLTLVVSSHSGIYTDCLIGKKPLLEFSQKSKFGVLGKTIYEKNLAGIES
jgi:hypothetical protein